VALIGVTECKAYCRVQGSAENAQFAIWLAAAIGSVQSYLRRPITAELRTFRIPQPDVWITDTLRLPVYPVSLEVEEDSDSAGGVAALVLTDADDEIIADTDYHLDERIGVLTGVTGVSFGNYPYTVVATVGLSAHPDYALVIEPVINAAILDIVADRWNRRNPAATSESEGGGVGTSYANVGLPERVKEMLDPWRMARAL
jgi:hypothetical protein